MKTPIQIGEYMFITNMLNFSQQVSKNKNIFTPAHRLMSFVPSSIDVPYLRGMDYGVGVNLLQANMAGKAVITSEIKDLVQVNNVPEKFYLSPQACKGILRRKVERNMKMNSQLEKIMTKISSVEKELITA